MNVAKKRRRKRRSHLPKSVVVACLLLVLCVFWIVIRPGSAQEHWNLIIVNQWNELPEDYHVELTELSNGQMVDSRIYPSLTKGYTPSALASSNICCKEG